MIIPYNVLNILVFNKKDQKIGMSLPPYQAFLLPSPQHVLHSLPMHVL